MIKRKRILTCLCAAFALSATVGLGVTLSDAVAAKAEISGLGTFKIEDGAGVRITATEEIQDGLRFKVKMDETTVAKIVDATTVDGVTGTDTDNSLKLYAVIAPADVVTDDDFTIVERENWIEIDESKIYWDSDEGCYYANAVLVNIKATNRHRAFTMGAVIEEGASSVWATPAQEGYKTRSLYETLNLALLSGQENVSAILDDGGTTYSTWYGAGTYPVCVDGEAQLDAFIEDAANYDEMLVAVADDVKATETFTTAVADGGALNAMSDELNATYYNVTFNADGKTLYSYKAKSGATAEYAGWTIAKADDGLNNTYTNAGWDEALGAVNADVTYTASFTAVANDRYATFKNVYYERKTIEGTEEIATTVGGIVPASNRYPYAALSNEYEWAAGKALTFNALNNSDTYEYTFAVYMKSDRTTSFTTSTSALIGYCTVEPNDTQTFTIYAEDFDYATYKYVTVYTSHYMTSCGQSNTNAQDEVATAEEDLATFNVSLYGFTFEDKEKPTTDDYIHATSITTKEARPSLNVNERYVHDGGEYSFAYAPSGNYPYVYLDFTREYDWSKVASVTFYVYNPYSETYYIKLGITAGDTTTAAASEASARALSPKAWTEVVYTPSGTIAEKSALFFNSSYSQNSGGAPNSNSGVSGKANTAKWRAFRLYVDDFSIVEKDTSEDYLWTQGTSVASYSLELNANETYIHNPSENNRYSLLAKGTGTWNTFMFSSTSQNWATEGITSIKFYVYNPTDYTYYINVCYATSYSELGWGKNGEAGDTVVEVKGLQWTEVTIDTSAWADGVYLCVRNGQGYNGNPASTTQAWVDFQTNGLYFDDFTLVK